MTNFTRHESRSSSTFVHARFGFLVFDWRVVASDVCSNARGVYGVRTYLCTLDSYFWQWQWQWQWRWRWRWQIEMANKCTHIMLSKDQGTAQLHFPRHIPVVGLLCCTGYVVEHVHTYSMVLLQQDIHRIFTWFECFHNNPIMQWAYVVNIQKWMYARSD